VSKVKSHKSVEEIAKKHRLDVSFVQNQLEMGVPIEHEHTKDKDIATDIALQHLDEIPDYYTRLKKMEKSAKSEHRKFKDVNEGTLHHWFKGSKSKDGKPGWVQADGSPCANEPGETKTPKCFSSGRLKALKSKGEKGENLIRSAVRRKRQNDKSQQSKSGGASPTNVPTFAKGKKDPNYIKAEPKLKESMELHEAQKDRPGKGSGKKDACYHKVKARYDVFPSAYASGALVKCRKAGASNWGTKSESMEMTRYCPKCQKDETRNECKYGPKYWDMFSLPSKLSGVAMSNPHYHTNSPHPGNFPESYDHEHSMARSELSTIVSAAKRLRKKMKGEGNIEAWVQSKITKAADYLDSAADYVDSGEMKTEERSFTIPGGESKWNIPYLPKEDPNKVPIKLIKGKEPRLPLAKRKSETQVAHYEPKGEVIDEKCWSGYTKKGMKSKNGKLVPNCIKDEYSNWRADFGLSEDWQKVNRQDKTDGLSQKAVNAYRRENPGSKLQTAVTEKSPKGKRAERRKRFCNRMSGMKSKLTSAKTARDPDSRINKALRRWRCK
jgi:hypothetical protein